MITADSTLTADSRLTADGRALLVATPGYVIRSRRRIFRVTL